MFKSYICEYFKVNAIKNVKLSCKTWIINKNGNEYVVQVVCTKKIFKKAVVRNLIKRRIVNAFLSSKNVKMFRTKTNEVRNLYKIYPNKEILGITFDKIENEIRKFCQLG